MKTFLVGLALAGLPWVVFNTIDAQNPHAILFGLGILTMLISFVGGIVALIGFVLLFRDLAVANNRPPPE
jgi:Na+/pantothenate symporter